MSYDTRMNIAKLILFIFIFIFSINSTAQTEREISTCTQLLGKSFIPDGEDHQLVLHGDRFTRLNLLFYPQFRYKLVICSNDHVAVEMRLTDNKGFVCYSNASNNYCNDWEFQFAGMMNGIVELRLVDKTLKQKDIKLLVGYKSINSKP